MLVEVRMISARPIEPPRPEWFEVLCSRVIVCALVHRAFRIVHCALPPVHPQPCRQRLTEIPDRIPLLPIARVLDGVNQIGRRT
jgi:hypothetical protein